MAVTVVRVCKTVSMVALVVVLEVSTLLKLEDQEHQARVTMVAVQEEHPTLVVVEVLLLQVHLVAESVAKVALVLQLIQLGLRPLRQAILEATLAVAVVELVLALVPQAVLAAEVPVLEVELQP